MSASSLPAISVAQSPSLSGLEETPSHVETLVEYLLASKRSLSSIYHVSRANEIVTVARHALEESLVLQSKGRFIKQGIVSQLAILNDVKQGAETVAKEGHREFKATLVDLDNAEARLQLTLNALRSTVVKASLRPKGEQKKSLHDFLEEGGRENLMAEVRESIDQTQEAQQELDQAILAFDEDIGSVQSSLASTITSSTHDAFEYPIPSLVRSLESHAKEMADLLESLVRHFDLCVTAIKSTEGGGVTARRIAQDLPAAFAIEDQLGGADESIDEKERQDMMQVLEKDAADVEEVVLEIRERLAEMEVQFDLMNGHLNALMESYVDTSNTFQMLEDVGSKLDGYIAHSREFVERWDIQRMKIETHMEELDSLREFYEGYVQAYDRLLVEVARRKDIQNRMETILQEAMAKVDLLFEEDLSERETFKQAQGSFLPADIWPGLKLSPLRYTVTTVNHNSAAK
ncbi:MAG: autophagy protein 17 [Trizodia sp. TS-e1964]|nr:MAG: autophagy protein 17 [Trizodia sp. TS-e1964]